MPMIRKKLSWKDLGIDYCDITHLHGFKELSLSLSKTEKTFWIFIILSAFAFTGYLIVKSVQDALDDKKQTSVHYDKYGNITLPILYCPNNWIDKGKMKDANISEDYVFYSMSYLRRMAHTLFNENAFITNGYDIQVKSNHFCNSTNSEQSEIPSLVLLGPFVEAKCLNYQMPNYYGRSSRKLIKLLRKITKVIDTSNFNLMKKIFHFCQSHQNYNEVWKIVYYQFPISPSGWHHLRNDFFDKEINEKIARCRKSRKVAFLTLSDLDNLRNPDDINCDAQPRQVSEYVDGDLCSMYNDAISFYMFHGEVIQNFFRDGCQTQFMFEKRHSKKITKIIETDEQYSNYLKNIGQKASYETFKLYMNNKIGGSFEHQNKELIKIRSWAEKKFKKNEENEFQQYLQNRNLTVLDIFKTISFDENKFLLGMSVDSHDEIRPRSGTIKVEKVINAYGVCYIFEIKADMKPITELPIDCNKLERRRKVNEKLYVNIIELNTTDFFDIATGEDNLVVFGCDARNLIPNRNSVKIKPSADWRDHYYSIEVSNLAYKTVRGFTECGDNSKNIQNITYTYSNCVATCFNKYTQPKFIDGYLNQMANCQYIAENLIAPNITEQCSFFTEDNQDNDKHKISVQKELDHCNDKCIKDCELITFDIKSVEADCHKDNQCPVTFSAPNVPKYEGQRSLLLKHYLNLSGSGPIWMKPFKFGDLHNPTIADMISGIADVHAPPIVRMEIQLNSDVTTYENNHSLEWYSYLGVVGGQINLIVSGSLLTLFQLVWWCSQYFYHRQNRDSTSAENGRQDAVVLISKKNGTNV